MKQLAISVAAAAFVLTGTTASFLAEELNDNLIKQGTLIVGTTGASPPSTMYDQSGNLIGLDIDLANRIAEDLGLEIEFVTLDWAGMLAGVQAGRFDMVASSVARTPERAESADFLISAPYVVNGVGAAVREDNTEIAAWEDLCGKTVGIVQGAVQINTVRAHLGEACAIETREYPGWTELLLDLQNGRIDALVGNYITPAYMITSANRPLTLLPETLALAGNALVIRKENPELAQEVDALIAQYQEDGTLQAISEPWLGTVLDLGLIAN